MSEFSRQCLRRLGRHLSLKFFLSLFRHFYDENVQKEIEKNRLVIGSAAAAFDRGTDRRHVDINELFEMTKKVDDEFVKKVDNPLFSIQVRYDDFAEIRKQRIRACINMVFDLLQNWQEDQSFADTVKCTYEEKIYREVLGQLLHLYNIETRMLSNSITAHGPAGAVRHLFSEKLFEAMEKTAEEIAAGYTRRVYASNGRLAPLSR